MLKNLCLLVMLVTTCLYNNQLFAKEKIRDHALSRANHKIIEHQNPREINDFEFYDGSNKLHTLDEYNGNLVIVNFWASWCNPCILEMPELDVLQHEYRKKPLKIIPISVDFQDIQKAEEYYKRADIKNLEIFFDKGSRLFQQFNVTAVPTSIIFNKDGQEVARIMGSIIWHDENIMQLINKYLPKSKE